MSGGDLLTGDALLRAMFASSGLAIALVGPDGRLRRSNPELQRMLGYSETELAAMPFTDLSHPEDAALDEGLALELRQGERSQYQIERRYRRRDGSVRWGRLTATLHRHAGTSEVVGIHILEDISEARAAAAAIASLVNKLGERVKELTALHTCAKLLLRTPRCDELFTEVAALLPPAFQYSECTTGCVRYDSRSYATPGHATTDWTLVNQFSTADGRGGAIEVAYHQPRPDGGAGQGPFLVEEVRLLESLSEMLRSSLDRRHAEEIAGLAQDRLDLALHAAAMGVWERDLSTDTVTWSPHLAHLVGHDGEMTGHYRDFDQLVHTDDHEPLRLFLEERMAEQPSSTEFRLRRTDGDWRPVAATGRLVVSPDGSRRRVIGVVMDITARRALEAGLQQAQKLEALGQVASGVAHDFNNLLCVVSANTSLLQSEIADGPHRQMLEEVEQATNRATALTRQLLAFSRRAEFHPKVVDLNPLITGLHPLLSRIAGRKVEVRTSLAEVGARVWADATQLEQLVLNLVVNARDAIPGDGTVTIATEVVEGDDPQTAIVVTDTGVGIPPNVIARLFEPFFTTKAPGTGTGLGLAVVRAVARQWQGEVSVESPPGQGASFRVRFPIHR